MTTKVLNNRYASVCLLVALSLLPAWQATVSGEGVPATEAASGTPSLRPHPAVRTPGAVRAMMTGSCRAGKRIVAVGDHGIVLLSDDAGKSFRQAENVPVRVPLTSVYFVDDQTGWAAGHRGVILTPSDGGENWSLQRYDTGVDQPLFSVHFKDRERGWAVGLWSLLLATKDGGRSWTPVQLPPPPDGGRSDRNLQKIFADGSGALYLAAEQGTVLRSVDDGATWSYTPTGYKGSFWTGIALKDGTLLVGGLRGTIYRSTDQGRSWREVPSGVQSSITDFAEANGRLFAVGLDGVCLVSDTSGASFTVTQREDRLPFTALAVSEVGRPLAFSKQGPVADFPERKKR